MSHTSDPELRQWMTTWRSSGATPGSTPEAIYRHVQRRSRMLWCWLASEVIIVIAVAPMLVRTAMTGGTLDQVAMALLAAICLGALGFSWWTWRGAIRASGESIAAFVDLSTLRVAKLARAVVIGWCVLGAEVVVFIPWIASRLYGRGAPASVTSQLFSWGLLAGMTLLGSWILIELARWARRERSRWDALRTELGDDEPWR